MKTLTVVAVVAVCVACVSAGAGSSKSKPKEKCYFYDRVTKVKIPVEMDPTNADCSDKCNHHRNIVKGECRKLRSFDEDYRCVCGVCKKTSYGTFDCDYKTFEDEIEQKNNEYSVN